LLGLEYLHYNNIVHRDIKAANILLRDDGKCQLADFGSSKKIIETNKNDTKSFCGTPYWMAPEIIKQTGHNRFADIWSLGCTVYEMIAGEPPWKEKDGQIFRVLNRIAMATKPPDYPKGISQ
jgi:serine/threonine protein kinase